MSISSVINQDELLTVVNRRGISYLALFGSRARGDATAKSDIDLAIRFEQPTSLFDYVDVQLEMEHILGHPVDLIPIDSVYSFVQDSMTKDLVVIYDASQQASSITLS